MDAVVRRLGDECVEVAQTGHEQAHAAEVEDDVGPRQRFGQDASGLGGGQVALRDDDDEGQPLAQRESGLHRPGLHHGGGDEPAERAGRCVLGVPVIGRGDGERILGTGGGGGGGGQRGGGAQAAGDRDLRAHCHGEAVVTEDLGDDPGRQV